MDKVRRTFDPHEFAEPTTQGSHSTTKEPLTKTPRPCLPDFGAKVLEGVTIAAKTLTAACPRKMAYHSAGCETNNAVQREALVTVLRIQKEAILNISSSSEGEKDQLRKSVRTLE